MKYLSIIYYDSFARFFHSIEEETKKIDPNAEFLHLSIFPSAWLYMLARRKKTVLLPLRIFLRRNSGGKSEHDDVLEKIAKYHITTGEERGSIYIEKTKLRAEKYLHLMQEIISNYNPDAVIFSGDTRIACEALQHHLTSINFTGKRYYFEQGPNSTTILDNTGVNANCSFRFKTAELTGYGFEPEATVRNKRYKRNPIYRGLDYLIVSALKLINKVPPEWDKLSFKKITENEYKECTKKPYADANSKKPEILVALQVPDDANNIHHNPNNITDELLFQWVVSASKTLGMPIKFREHPLYRRKYTPGFYQKVKTTEHTYISSASLDDDLANAAVVITVNSMTGLDAYLKQIPVIVLGNSFYDHLPGIIHTKTREQFESHLIDIPKQGNQIIKKQNPQKIFAEMKSKFFINGHFLDENLSSHKDIAKIITNSKSSQSRTDEH
ncbi:capsular polysaccharide export protein, LipB/KpsS family [Brachymonas sp. J145]|uniref:capsular polysaccharide export protein, LipB/KpsS family n=1 Tax=Brachymonas sp. J145 TaxID=3116489 RepID=UPI002E7605D2|nr:hypothetical protein [Brachymonas sp. J145]MEE1653411.1 hypothetical protein [Brachymonas sp. J145]